MRRPIFYVCPVPAAVLGELFGLPLAEARAVLELVKGKWPREGADDPGVSLDTVRNQLKQIFSKTSTGRRSEPISLVSSSTAFLSEKGDPMEEMRDEVRLTGRYSWRAPYAA